MSVGPSTAKPAAADVLNILQGRGIPGLSRRVLSALPYRRFLVMRIISCLVAVVGFRHQARPGLIDQPGSRRATNGILYCWLIHENT